MKPLSIFLQDAYRIKPRPAEELPDGTVRTGAVLLAEVVDGAAFFQRYGDKSGWEMLQRCRTLISGLVDERGGVSKTVGEANWAYFGDPESALACAVDVQKQFKEYNRKRIFPETVHLRIGIHYGDVILDKEAVFGSAAAVLTAIVRHLEADHIGVTRQIRDRLGDDLDPAVAPLTLPDPELPPVVIVLWEDAERHNGAPLPVALFIRYFHTLADPPLRQAWESLTTLLDTGSAADVGPHRMLPDKSIVIQAKSTDAAIELAKEMLAFLNRKLERAADHPLPLQMLVDGGACFDREGAERPESPVNWHELAPGEIHVTAAARRFGKALRTEPSLNEDAPPHTVAKLAPEPTRRPGDFPFMFRHALADGPLNPCFYCGSRKHRPRQCPAKTLETGRGALESLGYLSPESVNRLFFKYFLSGGEPVSTEGDMSIDAMAAFYDLGYAVQIRFLLWIWNTGSVAWRGMDQDYTRRSLGGKIWLAFDCLRTGNLTKSADLLETALQDAPHDYKALCCMGFLHLERDASDTAAYYFKQAGHYAENAVQRVFILFLLARLAEQKGDFYASERHVEDILIEIPECPEARYLRMRIQLRNGQDVAVASRLAELIREHPLFYCHALIDPEMAPWDHVARTVLARLYAEAETAATQQAETARRELDRCRSLLGAGDKSTAKIESLWEKILALKEMKGYLGFLVIADYATAIASDAQSLLRHRRDRIFTTLSKLTERALELIASIRNVPAQGRFATLYGRIKEAQDDIDTIRRGVNEEDPEIFRKALAQSSMISERLSAIESQLALAYNLWMAKRFLSVFGKYTIVLQLLNLLTAFVLLPVTFRFMPAEFSAYYLSEAYLKFYQMAFLGVGGVLAFLLAVLKGVRQLYPEPSEPG